MWELTASSLREALELRSNYDVTPYVGGTDLMVRNQPGQEYLFLSKIPELRQIALDEKYVRIGAAVTFTEALGDPRVPQLMKEAVSRIAAPAIRNAGTFGAVEDTVLRYRDIEATLIGKTIEEAKAAKADYLKAYADRMALTRGRVSTEYRKTVCMNLLDAFLTKFGI